MADDDVVEVAPNNPPPDTRVLSVCPSIPEAAVVDAVLAGPDIPEPLDVCCPNNPVPEDVVVCPNTPAVDDVVGCPKSADPVVVVCCPNIPVPADDVVDDCPNAPLPEVKGLPIKPASVLE